VSSFIRQFSAIFGMHLRDASTRLGALAISLAGAAGATFILVSILSIAHGVSAAAEGAGSDATALITAQDAALESASSLQEADVAAIRDLLNDEALRGAIVSPELVSTVDSLARGGEAGAQVAARALGAEGMRMRQHYRIVEGRSFTPGRFEVIVGRRLARDFAGFRLGDQVTGAAQEWRIVGYFDEAGGVSESEVWMDLESARLETGHRGNVSSVRVRLPSADELERLRVLVGRDSNLRVAVVSEREYQAKQSALLSQRIRSVAVALAIILGIGAIVATVNTMYSAMASRQRALATMRAVGFGPVPVAAAVCAECLLLGLAGALIGGAAAWLLADGLGLSLLNTATKTPLAFEAAVTLKSFLEGVALGAMLGTLAAVLPSCSAARKAKLEGLRAP
jgi:putative ABC transport system permease protein